MHDYISSAYMKRLKNHAGRMSVRHLPTLTDSAVALSARGTAQKKQELLMFADFSML